MFQEYTTADAVGGKYDPMATHFFNGEVAMFPNGPWMIPDFSETEKAPEGFYDKVGIMLLPGNGMEMVPTPGDMVGATDPEKIEAAVAFLKFETTPENQIKALEMTGLQPVSDNLEVPDTLSESDPLMAQALEIQGKADVTYGQNQLTGIRTLSIHSQQNCQNWLMATLLQRNSVQNCQKQQKRIWVNTNACYRNEIQLW